ncbi:uncharacterized protein [Haliotis cracherodii]|uniref:uncharacterized protein n=1 Tax=Haliotis cracherodii TaxID=6455 RepID=UPI0039E7B5AD
MFGYIIFMTWIIPLVKADPYELYKTSVMFREQCEALCEYISPCESFSYSPTTNLCSVWNSMGNVIQCPEDAPIVGNTTINMTSTNYADVLTYSCVDGYKHFGGNGTSVCQESGTWSDVTIVCAEWEEWGYKVLDFSSQYETASWHAARILSKFDVYPKYGDIKGSWAPSSKYCENGIEWIQVEFAETLYIRRIDIYETCSAGLVKTVSVGRNNTWNTIWTAASVTVITRSRIFSPQFTTLTFPSNRVRFTTDCTSVAGKWVEFDAIKIFGLKSPPPSST